MLAGDPEAEAQHTAARARRAVAAVRGLFMVGGTRRVSTGGGKGGGSRAAVALMGVCARPVITARPWHRARRQVTLIITIILC
jgi:hypothetical protein